MLYIYMCIISKRGITPQCIKYNSKPLDVVDVSLYFGKQCLLVWSCVKERGWLCFEKGIRL